MAKFHNKKLNTIATASVNSAVAKVIAMKLKQGLTLHQSGKLHQAELIYEEILKKDHRNFEALQLLGTIAAQRKNWDKALQMLTEALKINDKRSDVNNNLGNVLKEIKHLEEALISFNKAIKYKHDFAEAHCNRGNVLRELERFDESLLSYERAIEFKSNYAEAFYNRGIALYELKRFDEALVSFDVAIECKGDFALAHYNSGKVFEKLRRLEEALKSYDKAIEYKSDYADAYYNRGNVLNELKRLDLAVYSYDKAIELNTDYANAYNNRGNALKELRRFDEAIASYEKALSINPNIATNTKYELASLGVGKVPKLMPHEAVALLFDKYAERFDNHLVETLDYQTPTILFDQYKRHTALKVTKLLDLGCGTGLSGEAFKSAADIMVGVDLSEGMLSKARLKNIYTKLVCGDVLSFMKDEQDSYNLIVCSDVLVYIGDLTELFKFINSRLEEKGFFSFSIENSKADTYELKTTGRYGHGLTYIQEIAALTNFSVVEIQEVNLRKERGMYISGSVILLQN